MKKQFPKSVHKFPRSEITKKKHPNLEPAPFWTVDIKSGFFDIYLLT